MTSQIFQRASHAIERVEHYSSLVKALFFGCGPAAVSWLVITVIVDAINRVFLGWPLAHIGKEVFEGFEPSRTDGNASRSVNSEFLSARHCASLTQITPSVKFRAIRHAVRRGSLAQLLRAQAPAGMGACEVVCLNRRFLATVAATAVTRMFRIALRLTVFDHFKASESLAGLDASHQGIIPYFGLYLIGGS